MPIRPATVDDAESIARVHVASWRQAYRHILPAEFLARLSVERRQATWAESISKDLPHVLVAEDDGKLVGFSAVGPCRDDSASSTDFEVWAIYLSPSHWSKGFGRELWQASRDASVRRGARRVSLWVFASNERAIKFYKTAGFKPEAKSLKRFELGGVQVDEVRYVQQLAG